MQNEMTISKAIDILSSSKSVDSSVAYLFTKYVNSGEVPERQTSPMTAEKRQINLAITYAKEYLETGSVTA